MGASMYGHKPRGWGGLGHKFVCTSIKGQDGMGPSQFSTVRINSTGIHQTCDGVKYGTLIMISAQKTEHVDVVD